jgi:hypothetical protein
MGWGCLRAESSEYNVTSYSMLQLFAKSLSTPLIKFTVAPFSHPTRNMVTPNPGPIRKGDSSLLVFSFRHLIDLSPVPLLSPTAQLIGSLSQCCPPPHLVSFPVFVHYLTPFCSLSLSLFLSPASLLII